MRVSRCQARLGPSRLDGTPWQGRLARRCGRASGTVGQRRAPAGAAWLLGLAFGMVVLGWTARALEGPTTRRLSLDECRQLALQHNLEIQIERRAPELARLALSSAYAVYDPEFTFSAHENYVDFPMQVDPKKDNFDNPYDMTTDSFGSALKGRLPGGLGYGLSAESQGASADTLLLSKQAVPLGMRNTREYFSTAALTLKQPLLRDFWLDSSRLHISLNRKNLKIAELALLQRIINILTRVELAYDELFYAREKVKVEEKALQLAQQLLAETRRRVEVGQLPAVSEGQAAARVESMQAGLAAAQQAFLERQNELKALLTDDVRGWTDTALEPLEPLVAVKVSVDREQSWQTALAQRPDLRQFRLELEKRNIEVRYQFNQLFPSLDLVGSYGLRGVDSNFGVSASQVGDFSHSAFSYGIVLSIPLSNRAARSAYRTGQTLKEEAQLRLKKLEQDVLIQVDNAVNLIGTTFKRVGSTRQARIYAEAALEAEQLKLANGQSTSFVVLEMQRDLSDARAAEIRALTDYNQALAQLAFTEGNVLERSRLSVDFK